MPEGFSDATTPQRSLLFCVLNCVRSLAMRSLATQCAPLLFRVLNCVRSLATRSLATQCAPLACAGNAHLLFHLDSIFCARCAFAGNAFAVCTVSALMVRVRWQCVRCRHLFLRRLCACAGNAHAVCTICGRLRKEDCRFM